ncbi:hypothetical protein SteCoe_29844 [Stentor coeruleus]|uniref:RING-type domain-containing protein n=1 Tax=Stentor coeruleus TaxID=5963 RepID=A0A1R2B4W9_9CILI|nr:hypothetical protein SteCoe_29844 [Stentor coeruleus]
MVFIILLLSFVEGFVAFLSPDELRNITLNYAIPTFTKIEFMSKYGKLVFPKIANCKIDGQYTKNDVIIAFSKDIGKCLLYEIGESVFEHGGEAFFAIASDNLNESSWENNIYYNNHSEEYVYHSDDSIALDTFCLVLLNANSLLEKYKNQSPIWIEYSYKQFPRTKSPNFEFAVTSYLSISDKFFLELENMYKDYDIYIYNLDLFFVCDITNYYYTDENYDKFDEENCLMINANKEINVSYCYYSDYTTGYDRMMTIAVMLNYYFSFPSSALVNDFIDFLSFFRIECNEENYSYDCIKEAFTSRGIVPDSNTFVLYKHNKNSLPNDYTYSINGVFIYQSGFMRTAYKFADSNQVKTGILYIEKCNDVCYLEDLFDLSCSKECNTTLCAYDNLSCLQNNGCFSFMLGDGYCNSICQSDPDCLETETTTTNNKIYFLLIVILIPIIGGILLIIIVIFIIHKRKSKKKFEELSKRKESNNRILPPLNPIIYNRETRFKGENLCTLDLKGIEIGESVVVMKNCFHIYHYDCVIRRYEKNGTYECLICAQDEASTNRA